MPKMKATFLPLLNWRIVCQAFSDSGMLKMEIYCDCQVILIPLQSTHTVDTEGEHLNKNTTGKRSLVDLQRPKIGPSFTGRSKTDHVYYFSCSSWPPIAQNWIDRERRNKWPSNEIVREIVSKGCRIVHKSHPSSRDPDAEFRFSFSVAERMLFDALSVDQKKCFIAFKALVKYRIYRLEIITNNEIDLSSYHLKTIFLWTCETIPAEQWQTHDRMGKMSSLHDRPAVCLLEMQNIARLFHSGMQSPGLDRTTTSPFQ